MELAFLKGQTGTTLVMNVAEKTHVAGAQGEGREVQGRAGVRGVIAGGFLCICDASVNNIVAHRIIKWCKFSHLIFSYSNQDFSLP